MNIREAYEEKKIESKLEVTTYLDRLKYSLQSGSATINFQKKRKVDDDRDEKYTNRYTMLSLFPDEDEIEVLKRELACLRYQDYIETVKDTRYLERTDMRAFGKKYANDNVYIKIRVELLNINGTTNYIFVMSFHFAEVAFTEYDFPYAERGGK